MDSPNTGNPIRRIEMLRPCSGKLNNMCIIGDVQEAEEGFPFRAMSGVHVAFSKSKV